MMSFFDDAMCSCEVGQKTVRQYDIFNLISQARRNFPGDLDVSRQCRRLELALSDDGWRGNVEAKMDAELNNDHHTVSASLSLDEHDSSMSLVTLDKNFTTQYNAGASISSDDSPEARQRTESRVSFANHDNSSGVHMEMSALSDDTYRMSKK